MIYPFVMLAAVLAGAVLSRRTQKGLSLAPDERLAISLGAVIGATVGAKLPFLLEDWERFASGAAWFSDGKTILTGLAGGYLGVELAKWSVGVRTRTGDTFVVPVAAVISIGRIACFTGGCCYGKPTALPWGTVFASVDGVPRHPTQLYEALFHALLGVALYFAVTQKWQPGQLMKVYIVVYAVYRFFSEFLRPEVVGHSGLTGYQWASVTLALGFGWLWWRDRSPQRLPERRASADDAHSTR